MPHVVLDENIDLRKFSDVFESMSLENPLIRIPNIFVDKFNRKALLPTTIIKNDHQKSFIEINTTENKTTVKLYSMTDPEKTNGVKTSFGLVTNAYLIYSPLQIL